METILNLVGMYLKAVFSRPESFIFTIGTILCIVLLLTARKKKSKLLWGMLFGIEGAAWIYGLSLLDKAYQADDLLMFLYVSIPALIVFFIMLVISGVTCMISHQ